MWVPSGTRKMGRQLTHYWVGCKFQNDWTSKAAPTKNWNELRESYIQQNGLKIAKEEDFDGVSFGLCLINLLRFGLFNRGHRPQSAIGRKLPTIFLIYPYGIVSSLPSLSIRHLILSYRSFYFLFFRSHQNRSFSIYTTLSRF